MTHRRGPLDADLPRDLRKHSTKAELALWRHLRAKRLDRLKFRRQHRLGDFIVDFYCEAANLAVEVDGGGHGDPGQALRDAIRTRRIDEMGVCVLRVWNTDVYRNIDGVLARIFETARQRIRIASLRGRAPSPQPSPPRTGERG